MLHAVVLGQSPELGEVGPEVRAAEVVTGWAVKPSASEMATPIVLVPTSSPKLRRIRGAQ